ncbi:MAG: hypothetical protein IPI67_35295 [Myxococcales bacterium]|nr:hypothetical protein [Myxococcales bacterium]
MARAVDIISVVLLAAAAGAFIFGVNALGDRRDLDALYWLVVGGLTLRAATDMLRPKGASR